MKVLRKTWNPVWIVVAILAGIAALMTIEIIEEPDMTLSDLLFEVIEPTLIILTVVAVVYLLGRTKHQHQEQLSLLRDLDVARSEGVQWRSDMRELLKGLASAIDAQFDRWQC